MRRATSLSLAALLLAGMGTVSCSAASSDRTSDKPNVVASFYPLAYAAERIGGGHVEVTNLVSPGVEPHDVELAPRQMTKLSDADLVVYLKGFQPAVDEAVKQLDDDKVLDVSVVEVPDAPHGDAHAGESPADPSHEPSEGDHGHDGDGHQHADDPHRWLDPAWYAFAGHAIADWLGSVDPNNAADYEDRAEQFATELATLDQEYADGLADCAKREIIVSHAAFGHLTDRYGLEQIAIAGLSPEQEPTPRRLAEMIEIAREHDATVIFFETLVSPEVARVIADEVGAEVKVLDPLEGITADRDEDYFSVMRANLRALRTALECA